MIAAFVLAFFLTAVTGDVGSTLYVLDRCPTCYETNPLMRPFVRHPPALIGVTAGLSGGVVYGSMKLSKKSTAWLLVPLAFGVRSLLAARHNLNLLEP